MSAIIQADRFCDHGTPIESPCDLCTALGEMAADPTGISDDWRHPPVCDGCGQLHAVFKQCADGRLLCPNCWPNTPTHRLFATATELGVPPVAPGDGDLSRIRVADIDRFSPEGEAFLRKRAERKAKYDRINGAVDLAGLGAL